LLSYFVRIKRNVLDLLTLMHITISIMDITICKAKFLYRKNKAIPKYERYSVVYVEVMY
jgi:hypothetical protein